MSWAGPQVTNTDGNADDYTEDDEVSQTVDSGVGQMSTIIVILISEAIITPVLFVDSTCNNNNDGAMHHACMYFNNL